MVMFEKNGLYGFSLVELLLVLVILGITFSMIIPSWCSFIEKNRALAYVGELRATLQFARASAVSLGERVVFCGSRNNLECDGSWGEGQIVIADNGKVLRVLAEVPSGAKIIWHGGVGAKDKIEFLPTGRPNEQSGAFYYCHNQYPERVWKIILYKTGRIRVSDKTISCNF